MGTVSAATDLGGLVNLDVRDVEGFNIQTLVLGVGLGVLEQVEQVAGGLLGPATLSPLVLGDLGVTGNTVAVATERNDVLVGDHILEELLGLLEGLAAQSESGFAGVL